MDKNTNVEDATSYIEDAAYDAYRRAVDVSENDAGATYSVRITEEANLLTKNQVDKVLAIKKIGNQEFLPIYLSSGGSIEYINVKKITSFCKTKIWIYEEPKNTETLIQINKECVIGSIQIDVLEISQGPYSGYYMEEEISCNNRNKWWTFEQL